MTIEEFKARASMAYGGRETWEEFLEAVWQLHLADQHPHWIPVEEELPKHDVEVLVSLYDGYVDTDTYDTELKAWWQYEGEVEYWMPKPQPPRK